jgi:7-carboxy-7-deazaguanine synthase
MLAPLHEIFSSVQGEGLLLGERQVFVRFTGCNLDCAYCDTLAARGELAACRIERMAGAQEFEERANPLTPRQVVDAVHRLTRPQPGLHHSAALTGGEPLLHTDFLLTLLPMLGDLGLRAYLETNGTMAAELARVLPYLDVVCLDLKLPSATKQPPIWGLHEGFLLTLAAQEDPNRLDFVKIVVTGDWEEDEIEIAARLVAAINPELPVVLQPVTPNAVGVPALPPQRALELQALAKQRLPHVRIIPQMHRVGGFL